MRKLLPLAIIGAGLGLSGDSPVEARVEALRLPVGGHTADPVHRIAIKTLAESWLHTAQGRYGTDCVTTGEILFGATRGLAQEIILRDMSEAEKLLREAQIAFARRCSQVVDEATSGPVCE